MQNPRCVLETEASYLELLFKKAILVILENFQERSAVCEPLLK